jgi:hypothetical protein
MPSYPSVELRRHRKRRRGRKVHHHRPKTSVKTRQSWLGSGALFFGLLGLFVLSVQGILWLQAHHGSPGAMRLVITWVSRVEILAGILGTLLALLSFPFSARRQRNAVLGLLLSVAVIAGWVWLANWRWVL